jgi:hypothetical protein
MRFFAWAVAGVGLGVGLVAADAQAQQAHDGRWSVEVVTEKGDCDRAFRYPVAVQNGRIRYAGDASGFNISGQVAPNGAVQVSITSSQGRADGRGRIAGSAGAGTWTISGGRACSGRWSADKRS